MIPNAGNSQKPDKNRTNYTAFAMFWTHFNGWNYDNYIRDAKKYPKIQPLVTRDAFQSLNTIVLAAEILRISPSMIPEEII